MDVAHSDEIGTVYQTASSLMHLSVLPSFKDSILYPAHPTYVSPGGAEAKKKWGDASKAELRQRCAEARSGSVDGSWGGDWSHTCEDGGAAIAGMYCMCTRHVVLGGGGRWFFIKFT